MTVLSSKPTIREKVVNFFGTENPSTRFAIIEHNFEGLASPKKHQTLIDQLDLLMEDPRKIKGFLQTEKGKENRDAMRLLGKMIRSNDQAVRTRSLKIFNKYLETSTTRQNLMGLSIDPANSTKAENAFETSCGFIQGDPKRKERQAKDIANSCGYLYREEGDDKTNTTWKRGRIQEQGKKSRDPRLFNFFDTMQKTASGRLLHELLVEQGLQEMHTELYSQHIQGIETGLSNEVKQSITEQKNISSSALNPGRIWGDKSFINEIKPTNDAEIKFLNTFKRSKDFRLSVKGLEDRFITKSEDRKVLIMDFMAGFELLSFRKASLMKAARAGDDPVLNRAAKKIESQQKEMLEALQRHSGRDTELAEALESMFKAQGSSIFMYHVSGSLGAAEHYVSSRVEREAKELTNDYGVDAIKLQSGDNLKDSYRDLMTLRKESSDAVDKASITLANSALASMGRKEFIDDNLVAEFERWGTNIAFGPDVTNKKKKSTADKTRWEQIKKLHNNQKPKYFGLEAAAKDFENQFKSSQEPAIKYARNNFKRIYGISLGEMIQRVKDSDQPTAKLENGTVSMIRNAEDFGAQFATIAEQARKANAHNPRDFELSHAVTSASFGVRMQNIILGEHTLKPELIMAKYVNADTKAHQKAGFGMESTGHLERLLLSEDIDMLNEDNPNKDRSKVQKAERTLGLLELERRILDGSDSDADKKATIEYIHRNLLGEKSFPDLTNLTVYRQNLTNALGNSPRDYKSTIAESSPSQLAEVLKLRYKLDDLSISTGNISRSVMGFMRRESDILISGFDGSLPEGLFSADETGMLETVFELRDKITTALEANTVETEVSALNDMKATFSAIGFPVDLLFPAGSDSDGTWKEHFIFADPVFRSSNRESSDIIRVLIEIWNSLLRGLDIKN